MTDSCPVMTIEVITGEQSTSVPCVRQAHEPHCVQLGHLYQVRLVCWQPAATDISDAVFRRHAHSRNTLSGQVTLRPATLAPRPHAPRCALSERGMGVRHTHRRRRGQVQPVATRAGGASAAASTDAFSGRTSRGVTTGREDVIRLRWLPVVQ